MWIGEWEAKGKGSLSTNNKSADNLHFKGKSKETICRKTTTVCLCEKTKEDEFCGRILVIKQSFIHSVSV